ncbi:2TM domain-containing protein [Psychroserpens sp. MEBiC05023]
MEAKHSINQERYELAAKRVKRLKGYYFHVMIFIIINTISAAINYRSLDDGESFFQWHNFISLSIWGLILLIHTASVFLPNIIFGKGWEARRIKKYMEEEHQHWE